MMHLLTFVVCLGLALPLPALATEAAGGRLAQVLAARELRVCIWPDHFGITFRNIDQPGAVVAVAKGTLHEAVMKDKPRAARLTVLDTPSAREQEVQSGRADVFMANIKRDGRLLEAARRHWLEAIVAL